MNLEEFKKVKDPREKWWILCDLSETLNGFNYSESLREFEAMVEVDFDRFNGQTDVFRTGNTYRIVDVTNPGVDHIPTQEVPEYARNIAHSNQLMLPETDYTIKYLKDGSGFASCHWKATNKSQFPEYNYVSMEEPQNYSEDMPKTTEMAFLRLLIRQHRSRYMG